MEAEAKDFVLDDDNDPINQILSGVRFDENGLPITGEENSENVGRSILKLKRDDIIRQEAEETLILSSSAEITQELNLTEENEKSAVKILIAKSRKEITVYRPEIEIEEIKKEVFDIINDTFENVSEDDKIEIMFNISYDAKKVRDIIFESYKKSYKNKN